MLDGGDGTGEEAVLHPLIVALTRALLAEGLPQREIARRLAGRISRGSIHNIKSGKRRDPPPPEDDPPPPAAVARCPGCGGRITTATCIVCRDRAAPRRIRPDDLSELAGQVGPLGLDLKPAHAARYEEIRRGPTAASAIRAA